jgi:hypothetical protein
MTGAPQYDIPLPPRMRGLQRDPRGFVIPYFVAWLDEQQHEVEPPNGKPDFRILSPSRMAACKRHKLCWLCGQPMGVRKVFAIGPMCAATRTTMEPPGHYECALYSVRVCPFLSRPRMQRHTADMPEGHWAPGLSITRNPGVTALWVCRDYKTFRAEQHGAGEGELITVGEPERVEWYREGRVATRAEVEASIESGLPILRETADKQSSEARRDLEEFYLPRLDKVLPR